MTARELPPTGRAGLIRPSVLLGMLMLCGAAKCADGAPGQPVLKHQSTLSRGWVARGDVLSAPGPGAAPAGFIQLQQPAALAARAGFLYLADSGRRRIFRYDANFQRLTDFASYSPGASANIALAPDLTLYVADSAERSVSQYATDGRKLRQFAHDSSLGRPVALVVDDGNGKIAVADSLYRHVVIFSSLGHSIAVHQPEQARSIDAMAQGPDGLYLVDKVGRQVVVIGWDGDDRYTFGAGELKLPGAIAVDRFNRVFVSDSFDNTIKIFARGQLVASFAPAAPGFRSIAAMAVEQNLLHVAEAMGAQVQTFRIASPQDRERDRSQ